MIDRDPVTPVCPVCDAEYQACESLSVGICAVCGWPQAADLGEMTREQDRAREAWARDVWQALQAHPGAGLILTQSPDHEPSAQRLQEPSSEQYGGQYEYLTHGMGWIMDRLDAIDHRLTEQFDRVNVRLDAAIAINPQADRPFDRTDQPDELPLYSDLGLDYTPLALALSQADWRTADDITHRLINEAITLNRISQADPTHAFFPATPAPNTLLQDIARFPATDLQTLVWLWAAYSQGCLGLVAQISQWTGDYATFCDRVGWRTPRGWLYYDELRFEPETLDSIAIGHFPVLGWRKRACYGIGGATAAEIMQAWFDRWQQISESDPI